MKVLVACEYSSIVRDALENAGWDAWSCDLIPTESEQTKASGKHIIGDAIVIANSQHWDLLIGLPPCTYLSFVYTGKDRYSAERLQKKITAYQFFLDLWKAPIKHICLENPMGYIHTGLLPYTQIVEPYYFGDPYRKKTCLWLKNLPLLQWQKADDLFGSATAVKPTRLLVNGSSRLKPAKLPEITKPFQSKERSKFHIGIAQAMAEQWTKYVFEQMR